MDVECYYISFFRISRHLNYFNQKYGSLILN